MSEIISSVISAVTAGALAKAGDIGGQAVSDAYDAFRALVVRKLGKGGAVQGVEDEPHSEKAQTLLAEVLTHANLDADEELAQRAAALRNQINLVTEADGADIAVGDITARVNVLVSHLAASGQIKLGEIRAETGDVTLTNLNAGADTLKKA